MAAHQILIDEGNVSPKDVKDAQSFIGTIVWVSSSDFLKLIYYSRVLNQDLVRNRTEGNFFTQLATVCKSWVDSRKPMAAKHEAHHTIEFKVGFVVYPIIRM